MKKTANLTKTKINQANDTIRLIELLRELCCRENTTKVNFRINPVLSSKLDAALE